MQTSRLSTSQELAARAGLQEENASCPRAPQQSWGTKAAIKSLPSIISPGWESAQPAFHPSPKSSSQEAHHPRESSGSISVFPLQVAGEFSFGSATKGAPAASAQGCEGRAGERSHKASSAALGELLSLPSAFPTPFLCLTWCSTPHSLGGKVTV